MRIDKIAIFNLSGHSVNLGRQLLLADKLDHQLLNHSFDFNFQIQNSNSLLFSDDIPLIKLFKVLRFSLFNNKNNILFNIVFLELYTISFGSLINEISWYLYFESFSIKQIFVQIYYTPKRFVRLVLFRLILKFNSCRIFLPSTLRVNYVKNILGNKHRYVRVRNLLFNNIGSSGILNSTYSPYSYFFIAGNIYYLSDFVKVCDFARKNKFKVIVTSRQSINSKIVNSYLDVIIQTGPLNHIDIIELTRNCLAGIAVFCDKNINQNLAASSKLYEYAAFGKPIIVSRVPGVEMEVKEFCIKNVIYIDQLNLLRLNDIPLIQNDFDKLFSFENELTELDLNN